MARGAKRPDFSSHCFPQEEWSVYAGTAGQSLLHPNSISCKLEKLAVQLRTKANQLGIEADAALELVLTYERSKISAK